MRLPATALAIDLHHGAATLLVGAGVHPRVGSHVTAAQERQAAEVLEAVVAG